MRNNFYDELSARAPVWTDVAAIQRQARMDRNAYIAAALQRAWRRLAGTVRNAFRPTAAPRHAA